MSSINFAGDPVAIDGDGNKLFAMYESGGDYFLIEISIATFTVVDTLNVGPQAVVPINIHYNPTSDSVYFVDQTDVFKYTT